MPKVVQPHVVGARVATNVREGIFFGDTLHPAPDDDRELSFVVEELRPLRTPEYATMTVQGRRRFDEVRRLGGRARRVLVYAAAVGQVDGEDLGRLHPRPERPLPPRAHPTQARHRAGSLPFVPFRLLSYWIHYPETGFVSSRWG